MCFVQLKFRWIYTRNMKQDQFQCSTGMFYVLTYLLLFLFVLNRIMKIFPPFLFTTWCECLASPSTHCKIITYCWFVQLIHVYLKTEIKGSAKLLIYGHCLILTYTNYFFKLALTYILICFCHKYVSMLKVCKFKFQYFPSVVLTFKLLNSK